MRLRWAIKLRLGHVRNTHACHPYEAASRFRRHRIATFCAAARR